MKFRRRRAAAAVVVCLALTVGAVLMATGPSAAPSNAAKQGSRTRITIMVGGINKIISATATLAKNLGYYEKAGVDIYPLDSPAGVGEAAALVAGQLGSAVRCYIPTIDL